MDTKAEVDRIVRWNMLPAGLIAKDIITDARGRRLYNYEEWLRELANSSSALMRKTGGERFGPPESEACGENDAIAKSYEMDFKLVLGEAAQLAVREMSEQLVRSDDGAVFFCSSRHEGEMTVPLPFKALRNYDESALAELWGVDKKKIGRDRDLDREVAGILKSLATKKNLLLLFPVLLYGDGGVDVPADVVARWYTATSRRACA